MNGRQLGDVIEVSGSATRGGSPARTDASLTCQRQFYGQPMAAASGTFVGRIWLSTNEPLPVAPGRQKEVNRMWYTYLRIKLTVLLL